MKYLLARPILILALSLLGTGASFAGKTGKLINHPELKIDHVDFATPSLLFEGPPKEHPDWTRTYHVQGTIAPNGDYLAIFACSEEGFFGKIWDLKGDIVILRSKDKGLTWGEPEFPFPTEYVMHAATFFRPRGTDDLYAFGTEPIPELRDEVFPGENCPVGYRKSTDSGYTWSEFVHIKPENDPDFIGYGVLPMTEAHDGSWLYGVTVLIDGYEDSEAYVLRSADQGKTWTCLPDAEPNGFDYGFFNPNEIALITCENGDNLLFARNQSMEPATIFLSRSTDHGATWSDGVSVPELPHSAAPPGPYFLSDGKTIISFIDRNPDWRRSEIWFSISRDDGHTWEPSRFLLKVDDSDDESNWAHSIKYPAVIAESGVLNVFFSYGWHKLYQFKIEEKDLARFPTKIP